MSRESHGYGIYWVVWAVLLVLTVVMIIIGEGNLGYVPKAILLMLGSAAKASLIIFYFMHMRWEKPTLAMTVIIGMFLTGALMFALPAYDGGHVLENLTYPLK